MEQNQWTAKAEHHLRTLCSIKPNRRTGSAGNRQATAFVADYFRSLGYQVDDTAFDCLDYVPGEVCLCHDDEEFEVNLSPYSLGCDVTAKLCVVTSVNELRVADCEGKLLLLKGEICQEQLMPKNFVFYNPESHKEIIGLLEGHKPAAIIAATSRNSELVGALYPFPLIVDADFDIPNVYCTEIVGEAIARLGGETLRLKLDSRRIPSIGSNVIARINPQSNKKIVITAHIDAYEDTPGALDNASGVVVMMLLAEMLQEYHGEIGVEILVFNGEDHYSVAGQMDYLRRYGKALPTVLLNVNIDDAGSIHGKSEYSFYECPPAMEQKATQVFGQFAGLKRGEPWYQGDHMVFVQNQVPAVAFTSENMAELMRTVTHTAADTPDQIDCPKLIELAEALEELINSY